MLVLERAKFPRDKVCGDCLNPDCWPVLERLGVAGGVRELPHSPFKAVEIVTANGRNFRCDLPASKSGEIGIRRRELDALLLEAACKSGAEVLQEKTVTKVSPGWEVKAGGETFGAWTLVAADGRNSTVARLLGILPAAKKDRVALQTHMPVPPESEGVVRMNLFQEGYSGAASIGRGLWNVCLVARPENLAQLKTRWSLPAEHAWNAIAPLTRQPCAPMHNFAASPLLLVGDAARVVEPFTGEGIYYALRSGELAGKCLVRSAHGNRCEIGDYSRLHRELYRGRLWTNQIARLAVLHPVFASRLTENLPGSGHLLRLLTRKITG